MWLAVIHKVIHVKFKILFRINIENYNGITVLCTFEVAYRWVVTCYICIGIVE